MSRSMCVGNSGLRVEDPDPVLGSGGERPRMPQVPARYRGFHGGIDLLFRPVLQLHGG